MKVIDASALLALIFDEPGAGKVQSALGHDDTIISSVNLAEVVSKLIDAGLSPKEVHDTLANLSLNVEPLTMLQAIEAGLLRHVGRKLGLSMGDRCCLALAHEYAQEKAPVIVITADRAWKSLKDFQFEFIR
jgi:ribonuclease VapC